MGARSYRQESGFGRLTPSGRLPAVHFEPLVLIGRQLTPVDTKPSTQAHTYRLGPGRPVERCGYVGAPVDDDGVAVGAGHVAPTDVPALGGMGVTALLVDPAEEQAGVRVVDQGLSAAVQRCGQELAGDPVAAVSLQREPLLARPDEVPTRAGEVVTLVFERLGRADI